MEPKSDTSSSKLIQQGTLYLSGVDPDQPMQRSFILIMGGLGILWIILGVFSDSVLSQYGHLGLGLTLLLTLAYLRWFYQPKYVQFDEDGISGVVKGNEPILLNWDAINEIDVSKGKLRIIPKEGVEMPISLNQLPFRQHKTLIPQLLQLAERKGVSVSQ
ncbi:MAG: hypothetical protein ACQETE_11695 [Bacteroidota bacterium]